MYFGANYFGISFGTNFRLFYLQMRCQIVMHLKHSLSTIRARGRKGGRPKGMSKSAMVKATIAEALYKNGTIPVKKIAEQLDIFKTTLYILEVFL